MIEEFQEKNPLSEKTRLVSPKPKIEDVKDHSLRPKLLNEFVGQVKLKEHLSIFINASKKRKEHMEHILLYGPPGLGKTTLASIISHELAVNIKITSGPAIERPGDLAAILTNLSTNDILFVDEIHRLNRAVEEILYPAMEDFKLDIIIGKGPAARSIRLDLNPFTLIGATTKLGMLSAPLRDRFGIIERFDFYTSEELESIITRSSKILNTPINKNAALQIAQSSRGTPRIANRLLKRVRDWSQVKSDGKITHKVVQEALPSLGIDHLGLDDLDRKYLESLIDKFSGGPVGVETMAANLSEDPDSIEDVVEPYLLQLGFINRTSRGRQATKQAYIHLNKPHKLEEKNQENLLFTGKYQ